MKKCASCSKDLPDAAMHCVFCGAKQEAAPAPPQHAKTAFGYSANELLSQIQPQNFGPAGAPPQAAPQASAPAYVPPQAGHGAQAPTMMAGGPPPGVPAPAWAAPAQQSGGMPPQASYPPPQPAPYPPPGGSYPPPAQAPYPPGPGMGVQSPRPMTPAPIPQVAASPYLSSRDNVVRPIEPWKDAIKVMMLMWGALLVLAFVTPHATSPMMFAWTQIANAPGKEKLEPLLIGAVGVLAIVLAVIPMSTGPRGLLAAAIGLAGIAVPVATHFDGMPWQVLAMMVVGPLVLVTGLLLRNEYVESAVPRIVVTIGAACIVGPLVVPDHGEIPLVGLVKVLVHGSNIKTAGIELLALVVVAVLALLAWMPAPSKAGAMVFALLVIALVGLVPHVLEVLDRGETFEAAKAFPFDTLVRWIPGTAYLVLAGYGLATVIGKQLE